MPYPNEHAARQRAPGDFTDGSFRRFAPEGWPAGIDAVGGRLKSDPGGSLVIQSIRAKADRWTVARFRAWLAEHDFKTTIEPATGEGDAADPPRADDAPPSEPLRVRRFDRMPLRRQPRRDEKTGFLRVDASLTRAPAVFTYRKADGTIRREFRPAEHVFARRNLDSIRGAVVTNDHPPTRVTRRNVRRFQVGQAEGEPTIRGDVLEAGLVVTDGEAVDDMERGKRQISCGYDCDLVLEPGAWTDAQGVRHAYDAIQTNHETNHVAIVHEGRAGPEIRAHLDHEDAIQTDAGDQITMQTDSGNQPVTREDFFGLLGGGEKGRVTIDGVAYELPVATAQAVADRMAKDANAIREEKTRADKAEAERDAARKEAKDAKDAAEKADDPKAIRERVDARLELETKAAPHFDAKEWPEARKLDDVELMRATVAKVHESIVLDGKSEDYVAAAFDLIETPTTDDKSELRRLSRAVVDAPPKDGDGRGELKDRIDRRMRTDDKAWQKPIPGGFTKDGPTRFDPATN